MVGHTAGMRALVVALVLAAPAFHATIRPLPAPVRSEVKARAWHAGCPVPLSGLRLLSVSYWGFDHRVHRGQLVVNQDAAEARNRLPQAVRAAVPDPPHALAAMYGPRGARPADGDATGSFGAGSPCRRPARRNRIRPLVDARLRRGGRPEPGREPLRRLRDDPGQDRVVLPRPLAPPGRDGHAGGRRGVRVRRVGLGRGLDRLDEGLHALLVDRPLDRSGLPADSAQSISRSANCGVAEPTSITGRRARSHAARRR